MRLRKTGFLGGIRLLIPGFPGRVVAWRSWGLPEMPCQELARGCIPVLPPPGRSTPPGREDGDCTPELWQLGLLKGPLNPLTITLDGSISLKR